MLFRNVREILKKLRERFPAFDVIEESLYGHSCPVEDRRAGVEIRGDEDQWVGQAVRCVAHVT